jgi:pimeloyl-ACP methyl ester carboxylesterase
VGRLRPRRDLRAYGRRGAETLHRALVGSGGPGGVLPRQIFQNDPRYTDEVQPLYARIERPVMIVWGEEDRWIPLEKGQQLHEAIPGSQLRTIPRCAHLAQEDAPEAVAEFLTDFFAP